MSNFLVNSFIEFPPTPDPDYTFDFSNTDGWIFAHSDEIGIADGNWNFNILRNGTNDKAYYDLGSALSNTAWVMRFKCVMTAQDYSGSGGNQIGSFGMSSITGAANATQDFLGLYKATNENNYSVVVDDAILGPATGSSLGRPAAGTTRYHEMRRTSATSWTNTIYTDSNFTSVEATDTNTIASSIQGLQYLNITNWNASGYGSMGNLAGYLDDLQIWDGIGSL